MRLNHLFTQNAPRHTHRGLQNRCVSALPPASLVQIEAPSHTVPLSSHLRAKADTQRNHRVSVWNWVSEAAKKAKPFAARCVRCRGRGLKSSIRFYQCLFTCCRETAPTATYCFQNM